MESGRLFLGPEDDLNMRAYELLERVKGLKIEVAGGVQRLAKYAPMPFLTTPNGDRYYGIDSIERFVEQYGNGERL